ncbi:AI-2E family transporter [Candidatus Giovannonibacteria bacterium]|nr:AI-2E family transporter [Candidatus Giovannonibacteria bacterium]
MNSEKQIFEISTPSILKFLLLVVLFWLLYELRNVIAIILTSVVIASAIEPAAHWFSRYRIPRVLGVLFIYLVAFSALGLVFYLVLPPLFSEVADFVLDLPRYVQTGFEPRNVLSFFPQLPTGFSDILRDFIINLESSLGEAAGGFLKTTAAIFGGALSLILIIVISFYLSVQEHGIENFLRIVTPREYESYVLDLWSRSRRKIGWWLQGQFLLGILVGVLVFLGLTILGVKYALLLAILTAIFEVIPVFGPVMAAIPAVGMALVQKPVLGLSVLILYVIVQQFENHLIYPLVVRKTIGVPPLLVVLALVVGGTLGGFFGLLLSVPIAAVLVEIINDVARRKEIEL